VESDAGVYSDETIIAMINSYQGGKKYTASLVNNKSKSCSKGAQCCKKTGKPNASCDNSSKGCCSSAQCSKKKKKK
jgi:hypothetical protein